MNRGQFLVFEAVLALGRFVEARELLDIDFGIVDRVLVSGESYVRPFEAEGIHEVVVVYRLVGRIIESLRILVGSTLIPERVLRAELAESGAVAARASNQVLCFLMQVFSLVHRDNAGAFVEINL